MSTIKFTILKSRQNKTNRHPIVVRVTSGHDQKYIFTGYYCSKDEWDEETETVTSEFKPRTPTRTQINTYLIRQKSRAQDIHEQFIKDGITDYTKDQFVSLYSKDDRAKITVFKAFLSRIDELNKAGRVGYSSVFKGVLNVFSTFRNGQDLYLRDLTTDVLQEWITYLKDKRNAADTTINNYLRTTRTLYLYAINKKWVREDYYPFRELKVSEFSTETSPRALDNDKLEKLISGEVYPDLQLAKDVFIFSFFGRGISFIDISLLTSRNIQDGHIIYERKKMARKPVRVAFPIRVEIQDILVRYHNPESGYLLPILNVKMHKSEQQKLDRIRKVRKKVNRDLKIIGKQIGIEGLTTYWARHSYASYMFRKGMTPMMIKESLRHKNLKTTELYIKSLGLNAIADFEDQAFKIK